MGGAISGWPPKVRLSQPYVAEIGGRDVDPQGVAAARWSLAQLGPRQRFVADESNGRLLLQLGRQNPVVGRDGLARTVLEQTRVTPELVRVIRDSGVTYAAVDRRAVAGDNLLGVFFPPTGPSIGVQGLADPAITSNLDRPSSDRLFDSGNVAVYDLRRLRP